ncbi:MAG TPA: preprotein translocase subunit SecE [Propionibacteriaceae bacterium]|nr:preprotein translocase subunit SecE [Propionibacteriaceae bacterium]
MAKQDEVEPADESGATGPSDAADERTGSSTEAVAASAPNDSGEVGGSPERPDLVDPEDELIDDDPTEDELTADDLTEDHRDDADTVDDFDEIVRNAGVGGSGDPDGEPAELSEDGDSHEAKVLEPAGVAATTAGGKAAAKRAPDRTPKSAATAKRDQPAKRERTTPVKFVRQSVGELRKVVYPTGQQLINYFIVVLVFVLFVIAYVSLLDLGFGAAIFRIFS